LPYNFSLWMRMTNIHLPNAGAAVGVGYRTCNPLL